MEKLKLTKFKSLFEQFQPRNGVISFETIRSSRLDRDTQSILSPLLDELEESGEELTMEEFCGALDALLKVLTPNEKHTLLFNDRTNPSPQRAVLQRVNSAEQLARSQTAKVLTLLDL